jgi:hypothetical protein
MARFEVKRFRNNLKFGGVSRVLISSSLPKAYCVMLDTIKERLEGVLGYNISRATVIRFAVWALQERVSGATDVEMLNAYETAIRDSRKPQAPEVQPEEAPATT